MLYVYIELRYQRQLTRICPDVPVAFFSSFGEAVRKNGGVVVRMTNGNLYQFDDGSVGYAFSASRALEELRILLQENRQRIREYRIIVESSPYRVSPDSFRDSLQVYQTMILPDEGILLTQSALEILSSYISVVPCPDTPLFLFTALRISEYTQSSVNESSVYPAFPLWLSSESGLGDTISVLRDLVFSVESTIQGVEIATEGSQALDVHAMYRFSSEHPAYRTKAALDYLTTRLRALEKALNRPLSVELYGDSSLPVDRHILTDILGSRCDLTRIHKGQYLPNDLSNMPEDLLELTYVTYRILDFIYLDELPQFFQFLDKQSDFMKSLGPWMYSFGLLSDSENPRSLNQSLREAVYSRASSIRKSLDQRIGSFLWKRHEQGLLLADYSLNRVFTELEYPVPDSFQVHCVFHAQDEREGREAAMANIQSPRIREAMNSLELSHAKMESGAIPEALTLARDALHVFQKEGVGSGELFAFLRVSQLSLAQKKGDDAIVYLEYALENAESLKDPFILCMVRFSLAMVYFSVGNLHASMHNLEAAERIALRSYAKEAELEITFMKGRTLFELGDYRNAELVFQSAATLASIHGFSSRVALCRVWFARSLVHQGRYHTADQVFKDYLSTIPESLLFLLEASLLSARPQSGIEIPETLLISTVEGDAPCSAALWTSGFSFAEDCTSQGANRVSMAGRMYAVLSAYYRSRFLDASDIKQLLEEMEGHAKQACELLDSFAHVYYYLCFELARCVPGPAHADGMVYLSRAFKALQRRANAIGDNGLREQYMQNPVWNSRLYRAARENMLI